MDVVNLGEGNYEHRDSIDLESNIDSDDSTTSESDDYDNSSTEGENQEKRVDLKVDLQKTIEECYRSDPNIAQASCSSVEDDELQATALCQFMDILNDLDEVLDKSLLACLDGDTKSFHSDTEDVVCKTEEDNLFTKLEPHSLLDDDNEVVSPVLCTPSAPYLEEIEMQLTHFENTVTTLPRSKSMSDLSKLNRLVQLDDNVNSDSVRSSMRRLDPIVLPALSTEQHSCDQLTLPVLLFFEHHVSMRPTSAPVQHQVTAGNNGADTNSGPIMIGRRALLMNRTLSLPSPEGSDVTGEWTRRNTARSISRSIGTSSSSSASLNVVIPQTQNLSSTGGERNEDSEEPPFGVWPHRLSCMLACLSCTLGVFNISRFAMFTVHFGASFIVQFLILSLLFGIPLFTLHLCLGQVVEAGPMDMWRISPIFQGVGISMILAQAVMGMYSIVSVSWIFVYFRDSFINLGDKYKWAIPPDMNRDEINWNTTIKIQETIPQYFHGEVLQKTLGSNNNHYGTIKFQVAFNLAVIWMIVFVALSKGLRSYGKAVYMLIFLPIGGILVLCIKLLTLIPYDSVTNIFAETQWNEFFLNSNSWAAASQEAFLTWGLLGACIMQLTSHKYAKNKTNSSLQRESLCIIAFTISVLLLSSFLANICVQIIKNYGFVYAPGSFENVKSSQFLYPVSELRGSVASTPLRYMSQYGSLVGITVWKSGSAAHHISGWQPLQLATQIVPATLAVIPPTLLSPAWAVIFYFILIMFGIAQQLAIWHCVITGIMAINSNVLKIWESTITFLSCVFGLVMGLFLTTDAGIRLLHFLDYVWTGSWWQCLIHVSMACGVLYVRGRPFAGDAIGARLCGAGAVALALAWTVALPVVLCTVCIIDFRVGQQRLLYNWRKSAGYWHIWSRQLAVLFQQGAILIIPITAFIQTWRYMSKGPPDIFDRIQNLYRPRMGDASESVPRPPPPVTAPAAPDPPPKYTPPPSYSTATGARLMNTIRRSFRTLRRMTNRPESTANNEASQIPITLSETIDNAQRNQVESDPPDYSGMFNQPTLTVTNETDPRPFTSTSRNSLAFTREYLRRSYVRKSDSVKSIRSSLRRSFKYGGAMTNSNEHLVRDMEPVSNTVAMSAILSDGAPTSHSRASVI